MATKHSKRFRESAGKVEARSYTLDEAIALLQAMPKTKFDQTVELHMNLGIDPKQSDQTLRGALSLPQGIGATKRVICFVDGAAAEQAKAAGAAEAGADDLIAKVQGGWLDFDVAIAHPSLMSKVGKLGRVLGPQGKMPSPKAGTVTPDVVQAVREFAAGKVEFRNDDGGNLHVIVGKVSFAAPALKQNVEAFLEHIRRIRPVSAKGVFIKSMTLTATMSPGIKLVL
jgi:large subunit ribosomal protein L1